MKDDTISRQALLDAVDSVDWYHQNKNGEMVLGASDEHQAWYKADDIYKAIESVPSAQPRWIPCGERLPEKSEWYLLTAEWDDGLTTVTKDRYVVGEGWTCAVFGAKCLAWQPLPTPYREGRQDG